MHQVGARRKSEALRCKSCGFMEEREQLSHVSIPLASVCACLPPVESARAGSQAMFFWALCSLQHATRSVHPPGIDEGREVIHDDSLREVLQHVHACSILLQLLQARQVPAALWSSDFVHIPCCRNVRICIQRLRAPITSCGCSQRLDRSCPRSTAAKEAPVPSWSAHR